MRIWIPLALAASTLAAPAMAFQHQGQDSADATRQEIKAIRAELRALRQEIKGQAQEARGRVLEITRSNANSGGHQPQGGGQVFRVQRPQGGSQGGVFFGHGQAGTPPPAMPAHPSPQMQGHGFVFQDGNGHAQLFNQAPAAPKSSCECCCHGCDSQAEPSAMAPRAPQMRWTNETVEMQRFPQLSISQGQHGMGPDDQVGKGQMRFEVSFDGNSFFMNNDDNDCEGDMDCDEVEALDCAPEDGVFWEAGDMGSFDGEVENFFLSTDDGNMDFEIESLLQALESQQGDHKVIVKHGNMPLVTKGSMSDHADIDVQVKELLGELQGQPDRKHVDVKVLKATKAIPAEAQVDIDQEIEALLAELNGDKGKAPKVQKVLVEKVAAVPATPALPATAPAKPKASKDSDQKRIKELEAEVAELRSMVDSLIKELNQQ